MKQIIVFAAALAMAGCADRTTTPVTAGVTPTPSPVLCDKAPTARGCPDYVAPGTQIP